MVEGWRDFLQDNLHHLYQCSDHQDKGDRLHVDHIEGLEDEPLQEEGAHRREGKDEGNRCTHPEGSVDLLRYPEEGADTEELREDDVIDKDRSYKDQQVMYHEDLYLEVEGLLLLPDLVR